MYFLSSIRKSLYAYTTGFLLMALGCINLHVFATPLDVNLALGEGRGIRVSYGDRTLLAPVTGRHAEPLFSFPDIGDERECEIEHRIEPVANGFDIFFTLSNPGERPARRPQVAISGFRFQRDVETLRDEETGKVMFHRDRGFKLLDARTLGSVVGSCRQWSPWRMQYPNDLYAPVLAAWDEDVAVGISLMYDPFSARHDLEVGYILKGGSWFAQFNLHTEKGNRPLSPGEKEDYRLAVRFTEPVPERKPHPGWLDSLTPYKEFFDDKYGGVRYERDLRPVMGQPVAQTQFQNAETNPRGYHTGFDGNRVDIDGWGPFVEWLKSKVNDGYGRVMVWTPSGLYMKGRNFPTEFMTEWPDKLVETLPELLALKRKTGVNLGMWWGRSSQVSGGWDTGEMWNRDSRNPDDRQAAFDELDLAVEYGIDTVGMDAWSHMPLWQRYDWLQALQEKYPSLKFVTEPSDCDIMHTLAPTYDQYSRQKQRPVLADWLVPGHEFWIQLRARSVNQENFDKIVDWNCVPLTMSHAVPHDVADFERPPVVSVDVSELETNPRLELAVQGKTVVRSNAGTVLHGGECDVSVTSRRIPEGVALEFRVTNPGETSARLPTFRVPGIMLPDVGVDFIQPWKTISLRSFNSAVKRSHYLHPVRDYPSECYSPVLGFRTPTAMLGAMLLYDPLETMVEMHLNYGYDKKTDTFAMVFAPRDEPTKTNKVVPGTLAPGGEMTFTLCVTAVAAKDEWVLAFRPYRDFFQERYGKVKYAYDGEPVYALSCGSGKIRGEFGKLDDENPRGYNGVTRMDLFGWPVLRAVIKDRILRRGFRRAMIWQINGFYREHKHTNMVWEIATEWPEKMEETVATVGKIITKDGLDLGLWWGRAFTISEGFDSGRRHAWNPDDLEDNEEAFAELDRAYELGVRTIGCDGTAFGPWGTGWKPPVKVLNDKIFPMLFERYPEMYWVLEPAPCDFMNLWGGSFIWDKDLDGANTFCQYIAPGSVQHGVMKRSRMHKDFYQQPGEGKAWQERFNQLHDWGFVPLVFCDQGGYPILIRRDETENIQW